MRTLCAAAMLLALSLRSVLGAEAPARGLECRPGAEPASPSYEFLERESGDYRMPEGAVVGVIRYTRLPVFDESDPEEDNSLYRWANRFHIMTREPIVAQQILFEPGDPYDARVLRESSRILRRQENYVDAHVRPVSLCGNEVAVEVITRDTWSFTPGISFDRSGGQNTYSFRLEESNLMGFGKQLVLAADDDIDRESVTLSYDDNNLLGSRVRTRLSFVASDDGSNELIELGLPFFSLDSRRAWGIHLEHLEQDEPQYRRGDKVSEVRRTIEDYRLEYGFSAGLREGATRRWKVGYRYRRDSFGRGDDLPPPARLTDDRELSYPFLSYELVEDDYVTAFNVDRIYRTEDLHLGMRFFTRLGLAAEAFGSDRDRLVVDGYLEDTLRYDEDELLQHRLAWEGRWNRDSGEEEDVVLSWEARYLHRQTSRRAFFANLEGSYASKLSPHRQVRLGGLTGVRGFETRFQSGERRLVLSLEERLYTDIHLFNLIRLGWAVFLDVGRVWGESGGVDEGDRGTLANAGFGLRLSSSKAATSRILHLDFAFPLSQRNDPQVDTVLVAFNIKGAF